MRCASRVSTIGLLTLMLCFGAGCAGDDGDNSRVLTLPQGQITEGMYKRYLQDLLQQGSTDRFCEILENTDPEARLDTVGLAPEQATPLAGATPAPEDIERAVELIDDACEDLIDEREGEG